MNLKRTLLLAAVCSVATLSSAQNLIKNGGFEQVEMVGAAKNVPHPTQWTVAGVDGNLWRISSKDKLGVDKSRALIFDASCVWANVSQEFDVEVNTDYTVSYFGYYVATPTNERNARIEIQFANDTVPHYVDNNVVYNPGEDNGPSASSENLKHSFEFNSGEYTKAKLSIFSNNINTKIFFDNVVVAKKKVTSIDKVGSADAIRRIDNTLVLDANITSSTVYNLAGANMNISMRGSRMDISALPQGVYVVRAKTTVGTSVSYKFVK